jgi:hypothetical protein
MWNEALSKWRTGNPDGFARLAATAVHLDNTIWRSYKPLSLDSREITARLKRWQAALLAVRGVVMPIAALDPHKIAPIVCASIFGTIDVRI